MLTWDRFSRRDAACRQGCAKAARGEYATSTCKKDFDGLPTRCTGSQNSCQLVKFAECHALFFLSFEPEGSGVKTQTSFYFEPDPIYGIGHDPCPATLLALPMGAGQARTAVIVGTTGMPTRITACTLGAALRAALTICLAGHPGQGQTIIRCQYCCTKAA